MTAGTGVIARATPVAGGAVAFTGAVPLRTPVPDEGVVKLAAAGGAVPAIVLVAPGLEPPDVTTGEVMVPDAVGAATPGGVSGTVLRGNPLAVGVAADAPGPAGATVPATASGPGVN